MNKNIIFFDIDGTLVDERNYSVSESTKGAIKQAKDNGNLIFINTGRPIIEIDEWIKELRFDGYICGCGTYVEFRDKELFHISLGIELCKKIVEKVRECNIDAILEGKEGVYYDSNISSKEVIKIKERHLKLGFYKGQTFNTPDINFDKLVIWINENSEFEVFYDEFKSIFEFIHRGEGFYELVPIGYSKASGIEFLIRYLNIPHDNTYAVGDSMNDLPMLRFVKNSIAMGNSNSELFKFVSFITNDVEKDGIDYALRYYNII